MRRAFFEKLIWQKDRMLLDDLVFRLEHYRDENWELGEDCLSFYKIKPLVDQYAKFWSSREQFRPQNIFELGMWDGGSIAFWFEYFHPKKHVGIDMSQRGDSKYFQHYITSKALEGRIKTYWGTDQTDSERLQEIVRNEFGVVSHDHSHGRSYAGLDLVIDDASHMYEATKTSFETLFPFLRPGGLYIIEDWAWAHWKEFQAPDHPWATETALTKLIFELVEAAGSAKTLIASLSIFQGFAVVERGETESAELGEFKIEKYISNRPTEGAYLTQEEMIRLIQEYRAEVARLTRQHQAEVARLTQEHFRLAQERDTLQKELNTVYGSKTWRIAKKGLRLYQLAEAAGRRLVGAPGTTPGAEASPREEPIGSKELPKPLKGSKLTRKVNDEISITNSHVRLIAFYLPQFHPIPENDEWWGKGFTEWTNVVRARPLFSGHYQPHIPADLGFYDLRLPEARQAQADLAREYGIYGFCYYHYWFNGKRLLNRPLDEVLASGRPDFPFCLCWANEDWTRAWDGRDKNILIEQKYCEEDDRQHIRWLVNVFRDKRYIRIEDKPVFLVYRATRIPDPLKTTSIWREEARKMGVGEVFLCRVESFHDERDDPTKIGFDAAVGFQPDWINLGVPLRRGKFWYWVRKLGLSNMAYQYNDIYDYPSIVERVLQRSVPPYKWFPCVMPSWDNTPRRKTGAVIFENSTPDLYEKWLKSVIEKFTPSSPEENFVFINAWNEWGESCHLEPCRKWGWAYLEATRRAVMSVYESENAHIS